VDDARQARLSGLDELRDAVAEEERNRSFGFVEEPITAQIRYDFTRPINWLFTSADLVQFSTYLNSLFGVQFSDVELRADDDPRAILLQTVLKGEDLVFANGVLHIEDPARTLQINSIRVSAEKIYVHLIGTSAEARWVAQKTIELLHLSSGLSFLWSDFVGEIEYEAYLTRTKAHLGVNLIDLFSDRFKDFVQSNLAKADSLGTEMGTRPHDQKLRQTEKGAMIAVPQIHGIEMRLSLFDRITGLLDNCSVRFDVTDRLEYGQGILTISTELDSVLHTQLLSQLRSAILDQSKT
jgi:hypothetical protein